MNKKEILKILNYESLYLDSSYTKTGLVLCEDDFEKTAQKIEQLEKHCKVKKIILIIIALVIYSLINAQPEQLKKDKVAFNVSILSDNNLIGTSSYFFKDNQTTRWNIGTDIAYFAENKLAVICGISYGKIDQSGVLSLKFGGKYYLLNRIPLGFDFTGYFGRLYYGSYFPLYTRLQFGYAFFIGKHVSIEPTLRYNISLSNKNYYNNYLQLYIGFSIFI